MQRRRIEARAEDRRDRVHVRDYAVHEIESPRRIHPGMGVCDEDGGRTGSQGNEKRR